MRYGFVFDEVGGVLLLLDESERIVLFRTTIEMYQKYEDYYNILITAANGGAEGEANEDEQQPPAKARSHFS